MQTVQIKLAIKDIAVMMNKNGKFTISTVGSKYNESGVFQLTEKHLDNIADKTMKVDGNTLADAVAYGNQMYETSSLVVTFRFCKAGDEIGVDADGTPIVSSTGETTFSKDHWRTESFDGIELAEVGVEMINGIIRELNKERIASKRAGSSKRTTPLRNERKAIPHDELKTELIVENAGAEPEGEEPEQPF